MIAGVMSNSVRRPGTANCFLPGKWPARPTPKPDTAALTEKRPNL